MEEGLEFANNEDLGGNLAIMVAYYELHLILRVKWGKDQHNQLSNILKSNPSHLAACICQSQLSPNDSNRCRYLSTGLSK
ncbi:uncharacterized protein [Atheta coriaria]|uniref:uncharacterized protein isoform X4 n=1 Tax=Dalotia coriaria TaxID=877792 RepID=UPI0031F35AEA